MPPTSPIWTTSRSSRSATIRPASTIPAISGRFVVWTDERNDTGDIYGADLSDLDNIREFEVAKSLGNQQQATIDGPLVAYVDGGIMGGSHQARPV